MNTRNSPGYIRYTPGSLMAVDLAMAPLRRYGRHIDERIDMRAADLLDLCGRLIVDLPDETLAMMRHAASTIRALRLELAETMRDALSVTR